MEKFVQELIVIVGPGRVKEYEPMATRSAFRAGGIARVYTEVEKTDELLLVVKLAHEAGISIKILGSGTNMLVSDQGFPGVIIKNNCRRFEVMSLSGKIQQQHVDVNKAVLYCESGAFLNQVVRYTIDEGLSGLEYQLGLPGTIGGGVCMNSQYPPKAAFVSDSIITGRILNKAGELREVDRSYFQFGFDFSTLQNSEDILVSVVFALSPMDKHLLWERGQEASAYRIAEQPRGIGVGMTFRNMEVVSMDESSSRLGKPSVEQVLMESGGLTTRVGDVKLYEKRYNYILNMGEAKVADVDYLTRIIKKQAKDVSGMDVHFEGHVIGEV